MDYGPFRKTVGHYMQTKPILFGLEHDNAPSPDEIEDTQRTLGIALPEKYKAFVAEYGGGYFGFANIYSLDEQSDFYLLKHNTAPAKGFLRIADNGCGDYYLLRIEGGKCLDRVYFCEHDEAAVSETEYEDILEYLLAEGLKTKI